MIAWTSPLPTVRSIPWRISWSGLAIGATCRSRMISCWSVSVTSRSALLGGGGWDQIDAGRHEIRERHRVERAGDGVADTDPEDVDGAARGAVADDRVLRVVRSADHRRDRPFEGTKDLSHGDGLGRPRKLVAAMGAAGAGDETGLPEA